MSKELLTSGKYVIFEDGTAIAFGYNQVHRTMAGLHGGVPVSAGFFTNHDGVVRCSGESITLNLQSRPGDEKILAKYL